MGRLWPLPEGSDHDERPKTFVLHSLAPAIDLTFLKQRTKSNLKLINEMSNIFIQQTPSIISAMQESFKNKDWVLLKAAAHKLYPSLTIIGIDEKYQQMCKTIQEYDGDIVSMDKLEEMINELEVVCKHAFVDLKEALITMSA